MTGARFSFGSLSVAACALVAACSLQNFDYLKGEYKSPDGGAGGSTATAGGSAAGDSSAAGGASAGGGLIGNAGEASGGRTAVGGSDAGGSGNATSSDAGADEGGAAGEGGAPPVPPGVLLNPGFEVGTGTTVTDWVNTGTVGAATVQFIGDAHTGFGRLGHWLSTGAYQVSTSQVVAPLPSGNYTFSMWVRHSMMLNSEYIFAKSYSKAEPAAEMKFDTSAATDAQGDGGVGVYTQIILQHIPVTSGQIEVGIYTDGPSDMSINWSLIDDAALTLEQ